MAQYQSAQHAQAPSSIQRKYVGMFYRLFVGTRLKMLSGHSQAPFPLKKDGEGAPNMKRLELVLGASVL